VKNQLRIIAGKWRGRKLTFVDSQGLRPTLDRVRETLFNWLQPVIYNARCLDLYSGSGALGFEALSRGALEVTMVDNNRQVYQQLNHNLQLLSCPAFFSFVFCQFSGILVNLRFFSASI